MTSSKNFLWAAFLLVGLLIGGVFGFTLSQAKTPPIEEYEERLKELEEENTALKARIQGGFMIFSQLEKMSHALTHVRAALLVGDYETASFRAGQFKDAVMELGEYLEAEDRDNLIMLMDDLLIAIDEKDEASIEEKTRALYLLVQILESEFGVREESELFDELDIKTHMRDLNHEYSRIVSAVSNNDFESVSKSFEKFKETYLILSKKAPESWKPYFREDIVEDAEINLKNNEKIRFLIALNDLGLESCDKCHRVYR